MCLWHYLIYLLVLYLGDCLGSKWVSMGGASPNKAQMCPFLVHDKTGPLIRLGLREDFTPSSCEMTLIVLPNSLSRKLDKTE